MRLVSRPRILLTFLPHLNSRCLSGRARATSSWHAKMWSSWGDSSEPTRLHDNFFRCFPEISEWKLVSFAPDSARHITFLRPHFTCTLQPWLRFAPHDFLAPPSSWNANASDPVSNGDTASDVCDSKENAVCFQPCPCVTMTTLAVCKTPQE